MDFNRTKQRLLARLTCGFWGLFIGMIPSPSVQAADIISKAEAWFASVSTMQADFTQIASDGSVAKGRLYLRRPHRMKIEYAGDDPLVLITTPVWLHVDEPSRKRVTSYPISETVLSFILKEKVVLQSADYETSAAMTDGIAMIHLHKESGQASGDLILEFSAKPFQLRRWTVRDSVGLRTVVTLQNIKFGMKFPNALFRQNDYSN